MEPCLPRYGAAALADLVPSMLAGFEVPGTTDVLGLPAARATCLLLIDGMGWELLREYAAHAPFLTSLADREPITAGFPTTTATSVTSIGTGLPSGTHGMVGYTFAAHDELFAPLSWRLPGTGRIAELNPVEFQPHPTAFERATEAGVTVRQVAPRDLEGSGLTQAGLRGAEFTGAHALGDLTTGILDVLREPGRVLCYGYHGDLDLLGHVYGPGSQPWCHQLGYVDRLVETMAAALPADATLVVTADHGMVRVDEHDRLDYDDTPALREGVRLLGGEPRMRHVYVAPGATDDVAAAWSELLGDRAWVRTREQAIDEGWFGAVDDHVRPRIGDVLAAARGTTAITRADTEPVLSRLPGQHGSLTTAEQLIPLLVASR